MSNIYQNEGFTSQLSLINWLGLTCGVLMLILPFLGAWWRFMVGTGVLKFSLSPFYYSFTALGEPISSQLIDYVILAGKLTAIIGGIFMIIGSLASSRWWGRKLLKWGSLKILWMLISLIAVILIGTLFMNEFLPSLISQAAGGEVPLELNLPYLLGSGQAEVQFSEDVKLIAPMTMEFTSSFWLVIVTVGLGIGARIYNGRISEKVRPSSDMEEKETGGDYVAEDNKKQESQAEVSTEED